MSITNSPNIHKLTETHRPNLNDAKRVHSKPHFRKSSRQNHSRPQRGRLLADARATLAHNPKHANETHADRQKDKREEGGPTDNKWPRVMPRKANAACKALPSAL